MLASKTLKVCQKVFHCLKGAVTLQYLLFSSYVRESSYWERLTYVNARNRTEFESVGDFSSCLWERWLFHSSSLLKVAVWLRGEGRALCGNTVGGCALQSLGDLLRQWEWLLCSSRQLEGPPAWRGSQHRTHEWKEKSDIEELWIETLLRSLWKKPKIYLLNCKDKLI